MPKRRNAWSGWNYLRSSLPSVQQCLKGRVSVTFDMNTLQHIPRSTFGNVFISLNPVHSPLASTIQGRWTYEHPLYTDEAVRAQARLMKMQGQYGVSFAGAWTGYGFHEDGFTSGVRAAQRLLNGSKLTEGATPREYQCRALHSPTIFDFLIRGFISIVLTLVPIF